jgi:uncharacterized phage-associated protein
MVLMTANEHKIVNGIKYLVKHNSNVGRTKLFKLLYFWDFMFFKKYGMSVTCYEYFTYPFGPVPKVLYDQIINDDLPDFLKNDISIIQVANEDDFDDSYKKFKVCIKQGKQKIDKEWFAPIELEMLELVSYVFRNVTAKKMTEMTHLHNSPWHKTMKESGLIKPIDYRLAIDDETTLNVDEIEEYFTLQKELCLNGRI